MWLSIHPRKRSCTSPMCVFWLLLCGSQAFEYKCTSPPVQTTFDTIPIVCGALVSALEAQIRPSIAFENALDSASYTIVMVDTGTTASHISSSETRTSRQLVLGNIPAAALRTGDLSEADVLSVYVPPTALPGDEHPHKYWLAVLQQSKTNVDYRPFVVDVENWDVEQFIANYTLQTVATITFSVAWKDGTVVGCNPEKEPNPLSVTFDSTAIDCGTTIPNPQLTATEPSVSYPAADANTFYSLLMIDVDAPSAEWWIVSPVRHWIVSNIPGDQLAQGNLTSGTVVSPYRRPRPPVATGPHRYGIIVFKQNEGGIDMQVPDSILSFPAQKWSKDYKLTRVASNFFLQAWQDTFDYSCTEGSSSLEVDYAPDSGKMMMMGSPPLGAPLPCAGNVLTSLVGVPPRVRWTKADPEAYYAVMMIDPDRVDSGPYRLWFVANVKGEFLVTGNLQSGDTVTVYEGPVPVLPATSTRVATIIWQQPSTEIEFTDGPRSHYDFVEDATSNGLTQAARTTFTTTFVEPFNYNCSTSLSPVSVEFDGPVAVSCGNQLTPTQASKSPKVKFPTAKDDAKYTVMMVDPDAPSHQDPSAAPIRHWLVVNISGTGLKNGDLSSGEVLSAYRMPGPPIGSGDHRYSQLVWEQTQEVEMVVQSDIRQWNFLAWADSYHLEHQATNMFLAHWIDTFNYTCRGSVSLSFASVKNVTCLQYITPAQARVMPVVQFEEPATTPPTTLYTIMMTDPDAPTAANPTVSPVRHWVMSDVPKADLTIGELAKGRPLSPYFGPAPPISTDVHRYTITVWRQSGSKPLNATIPADFLNFDFQRFATQNSLSLAGVHLFSANWTDEFEYNCTGKVRVRYSGHDVGCRETLGSTQVLLPPSVFLDNADKSTMYAIALVDPDFVSPPYRHWVVTGVSGEDLLVGMVRGRNLSIYDQPNPDGNRHRYTIIVWSQPKGVEFDALDGSPVFFDFSSWANKYKLTVFATHVFTVKIVDPTTAPQQWLPTGGIVALFLALFGVTAIIILLYIRQRRAEASNNTGYGPLV